METFDAVFNFRARLVRQISHVLLILQPSDIKHIEMDLTAPEIRVSQR